MDLRRAIVGLAVIEEAHFLAVQYRHGRVAVWVEGNAELLGSLLQKGEQPGVAEVGVDDIRVVGLQNAIQDGDQLAGFLEG